MSLRHRSVDSAFEVEKIWLERRAKSKPQTTNHMKKTPLLLILLASLLGLSAQAELIRSLAWDASPSTNVVEYLIYTAPTPAAPWPGGWTVLGRVPATQKTFAPVVFDGNPHAYLVTAKTTDFESDPSNIITAPEKPLAPVVLRISLP